MDYSKEKYIGEEIMLCPIDTHKKYGIIKDVNDLGWTIEITESQDHARFPVGSVHFISHSQSFHFMFV